MRSYVCDHTRAAHSCNRVHDNMFVWLAVYNMCRTIHLNSGVHASANGSMHERYSVCLTGAILVSTNRLLKTCVHYYEFGVWAMCT